MPTIYLSPSTQPYNLYATGGSEQDFMNLLADGMGPYLTASGIQYVRKTLDMSAADAIRASNSGEYDLHLALHSNAAPEDLSGKLRGILVFYYPGSSEGMRASSIIAENLKKIYPLPEMVRIEPSTTIGEVRRVKAPSAFLEIGYHDNPDDSRWVTDHIPQIAQNIVTSLASFFNTPFLTPAPHKPGVVNISWGHLNIRERPYLDAPVIASASDNTPVTIINKFQNWYLIQFGNVLGYASADYITAL